MVSLTIALFVFKIHHVTPESKRTTIHIGNSFALKKTSLTLVNNLRLYDKHLEISKSAIWSTNDHTGVQHDPLDVFL